MMDILDNLFRAVQSRASSGLDYVELRADDLSQTSIELRESAVEAITRKRAVGHCARVLKDGRWGFAASDGMRDIGSTITEAASGARALGLAGASDARLHPAEPVELTVGPSPETPFEQVGLDEKMSLVSELCRRVVKADQGIRTAKASYTDISGDRALVTSEGTSVRSSVSHAYLMVTASGNHEGRPVSSREEFGTVTSGWEHFTSIDPIEAVSSRVVRKARQQMEGVPCKRGTFPCVASPRVAGMLAHEALGHLSEADLFSSGAFNGLQGKRVAPDGVTMVDTPAVDRGFGNIEVDDEGVLPRDVLLIDDGILGEQLTNREWAARIGARPTGNARAESFRVPPLIRMRNTYFKPGDMSFEELLEGKEFGYYCADVRGGQAEANSGFQVGIQECYEIRDGELGAPVRGLAISGLATQSLTMIDGLGRNLGFESSYCGKFQQSMATSDGGPDMSFKKGAIIFGGSG